MKKKNIKTSYRTQHTYEFRTEFGTTNTQPSLTIPGDAYTIPQLLEKARGGIPLSSLINVKEGHFSKEEDFEAFAPEPDFDFVDVENLKNASDEIIKEAEKELAEIKKGKKTKKGSNDAVEGVKSPSEASPDLKEESSENSPETGTPSG